jgi:hypothetical protein
MGERIYSSQLRGRIGDSAQDSSLFKSHMYSEMNVASSEIVSLTLSLRQRSTALHNSHRLPIFPDTNAALDYVSICVMYSDSKNVTNVWHF